MPVIRSTVELLRHLQAFRMLWEERELKEEATYREMVQAVGVQVGMAEAIDAVQALIAHEQEVGKEALDRRLAELAPPITREWTTREILEREG